MPLQLISTVSGYYIDISETSTQFLGEIISLCLRTADAFVGQGWESKPFEGSSTENNPRSLKHENLNIKKFQKFIHCQCSLIGMCKIKLDQLKDLIFYTEVSPENKY